MIMIKEAIVRYNEARPESQEKMTQERLAGIVLSDRKICKARQKSLMSRWAKCREDIPLKYAVEICAVLKVDLNFLAGIGVPEPVQDGGGTTD